MPQAEVHGQHRAHVPVVDQLLRHALLRRPRVKDRPNRGKRPVLDQRREVTVRQGLTHALKPSGAEVLRVVCGLRQVRLAAYLPSSFNPPRRLDRDATRDHDGPLHLPALVGHRYTSTRPRHVEHVGPQYLALVDQHRMRVETLDG